MVAGNIVFARAFNFKFNFVANGNGAFQHGANHNGSAVRQFFGGFNFQHACRCNNAAGVAKLSAAFSVERGNIADNCSFFAVLHAVNRLCIVRRVHGNNFAAFCAFVNLQSSKVNAAGVVNNRTSGLIVAGVARHFALYFQCFVKAFFVQRHAFFFKDFGSQLTREAESIA